jgi:hypothetical protein
MTTKNRILLLLAGVLLVTVNADAGVRKGAIELDTNWLFSYTKMDTSSSGSIGGRFGMYKFLTDQFQLGGAVQDFYTHSSQDKTVYSSSTSSDSNTLGLNAVAKFYLATKDSTVAPFVGAQFGYARMDMTGPVSFTGTAYGGIAGLKIFPTENSAINFEANLTSNNLTGPNNSKNNSTDFKALIGVSVFIDPQ